MISELSIVVVGSVNLDLVASVEKLPVAGETVTGAELNRYPGGKGANQALAAPIGASFLDVRRRYAIPTKVTDRLGHAAYLLRWSLPGMGFHGGLE